MVLTIIGGHCIYKNIWKKAYNIYRSSKAIGKCFPALFRSLAQVSDVNGIVHVLSQNKNLF